MGVCLYIGSRSCGFRGLVSGVCVNVYNVVVSGDAPSLSCVPLCAGSEDVGSIDTAGDDGNIVVARDQSLPWVVAQGC